MTDYACPGRLTYRDGDDAREYHCTLLTGHPGNHETWHELDLVAEWSDESSGAWRAHG